MNPVRILLLCSSRLALPAMQELAFFGQLAVVVIPSHSDDMIAAAQFMLTGTKVPILLTEKTSYVEQLKVIIADYSITVGLIITFSYKIPPSVYLLAEKGFYNVHPGPLPSYRGSDPVFHQIKNKEQQAGVTVHELSEGFDEGPIVITEMIRLDPEDTYGILTTKLAQVAARLTMLLCKLINFDLTVPSKEQDESKAVYHKRQTATDISINWQSMDAETIIALINACNPWNKGASTKIKNRIIRFLEARIINKPATPDQSVAGTIASVNNDGITVYTINNQLMQVRIIYVEEGVMNAARLAETGITTGDRFENI